MGRVGTVQSFVRKTVDDAHVTDVKLDSGSEGPVTAPHFSSPGDDSPPLAGDFVVTVESAGAGNEVAVGYFDPKNEPQAAKGEKRIYSRNASGDVKVVVWLKSDGSLVIENDNGAIELKANGDVDINGVTIDANGNIRAAGEVTAKASSTPVSLSTHVHPTPSGASSAPTPGT